MKSSRQIGVYYENRSLKLLQKMNYVCEKTSSKVVWIHGKPISLHADLMGCADILAIGEHDVAFVQVKFKGENTSISMKNIEAKFDKIPNVKCTCGQMIIRKIVHIWRKGDRMPEVILL